MDREEVAGIGTFFGHRLLIFFEKAEDIRLLRYALNFLRADAAIIPAGHPYREAAVSGIAVAARMLSGRTGET